METKFCGNCGNVVGINENFCSACGAPLNTTYSEQPQSEDNTTVNQETVDTNEQPQEQDTFNQTQQQEPTQEQTQPQSQPQAQATSQPAQFRQMLRTNRGLAKFFFLSLITFGIYGIVVMSHISTEINDIATKHDGRKTMHYCLIYFIFSWLTFGIAPLVWYHRLSDRIGDELVRRHLPYSFGAGTWWGWGFFGALLFGIGPLIYIHKLMKAMNFLAADYNVNG